MRSPASPSLTTSLGGLPSYGCNLGQGETILTFQPSSPGLDSYNFVVKSIKLNYNLPSHPPLILTDKYQILAGNLKLDTFIRVIFKHWAQLLGEARNMDRKSIKIQQLWRCNDCYLSLPIRLWSHFFSSLRLVMAWVTLISLICLIKLIWLNINLILR